MAATLLPPRETNADTLAEVAVEFPDNFLLIELCGEFDRNLAEIEQKLSVQILRRGNHLVAMGEKPAAEEAVQVLRKLYARLEAGRPVGPGDIDRELRMPDANLDRGKSRDGKQIEMFKGGPVEIKTRKKVVEPRTEAQKAYVQNLFQHEMAFGIGPAGTGKTYLAVAVGVSMFIDGLVDKIILSRPAVEAGEKLGYLPGDMKDKVDPYMQPVWDALNECFGVQEVERRKERREIEVAPLAFMRGRTLKNAFVVIDEAQNATIPQMKMVLTRLGRGSRMVVTGDPSQSDLEARTASGLAHAMRILDGVKGVSIQTLTAVDVVRHEMVARIIDAYARSESVANEKADR